MMERKEMMLALSDMLCRLRPELQLNADNLREDIHLKNDLAINSVTMLMLALTIEKKFDIRFASVSPDQLQTLGDVCDYIESRMEK